MVRPGPETIIDAVSSVAKPTGRSEESSKFIFVFLKEKSNAFMHSDRTRTTFAHSAEKILLRPAGACNDCQVWNQVLPLDLVEY